MGFLQKREVRVIFAESNSASGGCEVKTDSVSDTPWKQTIERAKKLGEEIFKERLARVVSQLGRVGSVGLKDLPRQLGTIRHTGGRRLARNRDLVRISKSFSGLRVGLVVENSDGGTAAIRILAYPDRDLDGSMRVTLTRNGRDVSSLLLEGTSVVFEEVAFGRYVLVLTRNGHVKGEFPFEIKETRHDRGRKKRREPGRSRH